MPNKVSIIIPTYNRIQFLEETLNSIAAQSYANLECIVVDDGSTDNTKKLLQGFCMKDKRFKYYHRPTNKLKGANSCRNFGFQKSTGDYIIWFDSDDLMTLDHIEAKFRLIENSNYDFVIAQTQNFGKEKFYEPYTYEKKPYGITAEDYILLKIHLYTCDIIMKREVAEKISWNEEMSSWQDYNYFCKMILVTKKGIYLDKILTHRRLHGNSIQDALNLNKLTFNRKMIENRWLTFKDIVGKVDKKIMRELIYGMMNLSFELMKYRSFSKEIYYIILEVRHNLGLISSIKFIISLKAAFLFKKGNFLLEQAKMKNKV